MRFTGGCYCGAVRYEATGEPAFKGQCHCRECQYFAGGQSNLFMGMPAAGFHYSQGQPAAFRRDDLPAPVTREFCARCGTQIATHVPSMEQLVFLKVGTLDDPELYGGPQVAIFTVDKRSFHRLPEGVPAFERMPT